MNRRTSGVAVAVVLGAAAVVVLHPRRAMPRPPPAGIDLSGDPLPPFAVARIGTLRRPTGSAGIAFTADGTGLRCGGRDGVVREFDVATGSMRREERVCERFAEEPRARGRFSCISDLFDRPADPLVPDLPGRIALGRDGVFALVGSVHASGSSDGSTWSTAATPSSWPAAVAITPDGTCAAAVWSDGRVDAGMPPVRIASVSGAPQAVALSPDGSRVAIQAMGLHLLDARTGAVLGAIASSQGRNGVAFSPDGSRLVHAQDRDTLVLRDAATLGVLWSVSAAERPNWGEATFSPDGRRIACAGPAVVTILDAASGAVERTLPCANAFHVAFSPDGERLAASGLGAVRAWRVATGTPLLAPTHPAGSVFGIAFSPDGRRIAAWGVEGEVGVWDAVTGALVRQLTADGSTSDLSWSPDGGSLRLVTNANGASSLCTYSASDGARSASVALPQCSQVVLGGARPLLLSHVLAGTTGDRWDVVDLATQSTVCTLALTSTGGPDAHSRDGRFAVAATGRNRLEVYDLASGRCMPGGASWSNRDGAARLSAMSADGAVVAVGLEHGRVVVARSETGGIRASFDTGLHGAACGLALSADGRLLAVGDAFGDVHVWSVEEEAELVVFGRHRGPVWALDFSPDGSRLASAGEDATVLVWDVSGFSQ